MFKKRPEVLSPAGSEESLAAAVLSGADAVYLGVKNFSARRNADNFDDFQLEKAIDYCHDRNVKVYLTLNTMIKSKELSSAFNTAKKAYEFGADALIISDLGLAGILRKEIPGFELHASTQLSVHSPAALEILKEKGFKRVVAAREMSKDNLAEFCKKADELNIETEVFVHGALCMSVSGQCLMSSMLGGRSGNRGLCAGPCRLPFSASDDRSRHDLSLKDLSLIEHIEELSKMGVSSLKIEGRMKRPEYVAAATAVCRMRAEGGCDKELESDLKKIFSRSGFTDGYFEGKKGKEMFGIRTKEDVISSSEAIKKIHGLYRKERNSVPVEITFKAAADKPCKCSMTYGKFTVEKSGPAPQKSINKALTASDIEESFKKLGSTPYFLNNSDIKIDKNIFISSKDLNELRRNLCESLSEKRIQDKKNVVNAVYNYDKTIVTNNNISKEIILKIPDIKRIPVNTYDIFGIILPLKSRPEKSYPKTKLIAEIPRLITDENAVLNELKIMKSIGFSYAFCSELSAITLSKKAGLIPIGAPALNICNYESVREFEKSGAKINFVSAEIQAEEIPLLKSENLGCFAYGRLPLMITANCPVNNSKDCSVCKKRGAVKDRMGISFPVCCKNGYCEILNSKVTYLADRLNELNVKYLLLSFEKESKKEIEETVRKYKSGSGPDGDYTRGLYFRNLL